MNGLQEQKKSEYVPNASLRIGTKKEEKFKVIKDFPKYSVSNFGRIKRNVKAMRGKWKDGFFLKTNTPGNHGYASVILTSDQNKLYRKLVHRLVLETFIGVVESKPFCNHKDGNKMNNHLCNLEWCTGKENTEHAINSGLFPQFGETNSCARLTVGDVLTIRNLLKTKGDLEIAKEYRVHWMTIHNIKTGRTWNTIK